MKTRMQNPFLLPALMAALGLMLADRATAQTFTTLHNFTGGSDGGNLNAGLILSGKTLYGAADSGGSGGNGTVFSLNTNGTGFTVLHSFTALASETNSDGAAPAAGLILSDNTLYRGLSKQSPFDGFSENFWWGAIERGSGLEN